jgi:hypothetical protein
MLAAVEVAERVVTQEAVVAVVEEALVHQESLAVKVVTSV